MRYTTHYDITMGNDVAVDIHCDSTMDNEVTRDIHCDVTISNVIAICIYIMVVGELNQRI